jgi:hypothetical protein
MEDGQALMIWLIVGAIAGWLAGMPVKGGGNGLIGDITAPLPPPGLRLSLVSSAA